MTLARVHNLAISLDGFASGEGQSLEAPFGHAGERLMSGCSPSGSGGRTGKAGVDDASRAAWRRVRCRDHGRRQVQPAGLAGRRRLARLVGPEPALPHPDLRAHSPTRGRRSRRRAAPRSSSSTPPRPTRCGGDRARRRAWTCGSAAVPPSSATSSRPVSSTTCTRAGADRARPRLRVWDGLEGLEDTYDVEAVSMLSGITYFTFTRNRDSPGRSGRRNGACRVPIVRDCPASGR